MEHYRTLADAIILQAVKDYREALKRVQHRPYNHDAVAMKAECERFFRSEWFGLLTKIDPEVLILGLQSEVD